MTSIFPHNYSTIKIKRHLSKKINPLTCVFGILVNDNGLKIESEMLEWLLPEYDVYKIYQKYPGLLFEYPALKFAQWLTEKFNISFILYLHTKGATHKNFKGGEIYIRKFWEKEFTKPRNILYISLIVNNKSDIVTPLSNGIFTWYNGMYISKRAFELNNIYPFDNRFIYEYYFSNNTRIKGIIAENCKKPWNYLNLFNDKIIKNISENIDIIAVSKNKKKNSNKYSILFLIFYLNIIFIIKKLVKIKNIKNK